MANINVHCLNCGSSSLKVRTSQRIGMRTVEVLLVCNNCHARNHSMTEIHKLEIATFIEKEEALRINKPLLQIDETKTNS